MNELQELEQMFLGVMAGDIHARNHLFERFESRLRCTLWTFARDTRYSHSDMVQSAFCHLFEDAQTGKVHLRSEHEVFGLLVRYAHNRARTGKRRDRVALRHASRYALTRVQTAEPGKALETAELIEAMRSQLTPVANQLLDLKTQGKSFEEIAQIVGKSHAAVEKLYYRTLHGLRELAARRNYISSPPPKHLPRQVPSTK